MEITSLPQNVLLDILMRLPVKPLIRFSLSCKQYLSLIHHPHFINRHLTHSKIYPSRDDNFLLLCYSIKDHDQYYSLCSLTDGGKIQSEDKRFRNPFKFGNGRNSWAEIIGSSNGLVCLSVCDTVSYQSRSIILWNVVIGKYKELPHPCLSTYPHSRSFLHVSIGFGFVLETNDFKVVQIMRCHGSDGDEVLVPDVWVYSMELDTWRKIEANIALCSKDNVCFFNVYVNGAVHWLVYSSMGGFFPRSIMSFDMKGEIFKEMALPNNHGNVIHSLEIFSSACGETLSLFIKFKDSNHWEVWLMKEYGFVDSWTRQFCIIAEGQISRPLKVMHNGDVLLEVEVSSRNHNKLVLYDAKNQKMMDLGTDMKSFRIVNCSSSLSLLDVGEKEVSPPGA